MSTLQAIRVGVEPMRVVGFAALAGAAYVSMGTKSLHPTHQVSIQNSTDSYVYISLDGVTDHFMIPEYSGFFWDITTNKSFGVGFYLPIGTRFWVKQINGAPTEGEVSATFIYGADI
jgi:hypothetical protein